LKRSLLKEISQKEAIIAETNDKLQDLRAEKSELVEQVSYLSDFMGALHKRTKSGEFCVNISEKLVTFGLELYTLLVLRGNFIC